MSKCFFHVDKIITIFCSDWLCHLTVDWTMDLDSPVYHVMHHNVILEHFHWIGNCIIFLKNGINPVIYNASIFQNIPDSMEIVYVMHWVTQEQCYSIDFKHYRQSKNRQIVIRYRYISLSDLYWYNSVTIIMMMSTSLVIKFRVT